MNRWVTNGLLIVLAALAGSTAYFATKASVLQNHLNRRGVVAEQAGMAKTTPEASSSSITPTSSPTSSGTTPVTGVPTAVAATDRLSQPSETYTVVAGDTLYPVSLKNNMTLERLAEANSLKDPYKLTIGQILLIPEVNAKQNVFEIRFTTDPNRAAQFQTVVSGGAEAWRLSPKEVAKAESDGAFGLGASDDYRETSRDETKGIAVVTVSRLVGSQTKTYEVTLTQPATKGTSGIWSITKIAPKGA